MPHPAGPKIEFYRWLANQTAEADRVLAGLVLGNAPDHVIADHQLAMNGLLVRLDRAHAAVMRSLCGR